MAKKQSKPFQTRHLCTLGKLHGIHERKISPQARWYQKWWFNFREFCTISSNVHSKRRFRSNAEVMKEKLRHLSGDQYRFIIHPFSKFIRYKEFFITFIWIILFLVDPYVASFNVLTYFQSIDDSKDKAHDFISWILNIVLTVDVIIRFFTGFIIPKTGEIVLKPKMVIHHYLKTYFVIDCLPVLTTLFLFIIQSHVSIKILVIVIQFKSLRILRLTTLIYNLKLFLKIIFVRGDVAYTIASIVIIGIFFIHWWTCFVALLHIIPDVYGFSTKQSWIIIYNEEIYTLKVLLSIDKFDDSISYYIIHLHIVLCHFYGSGIGKYRTSDPYERLTFSLIIMSGLIYNIVAIAYILQVFGTVNISEAKFEELDYNIQEFMTKSRFPKTLRRRMNKYLDHKYSKKFFSENMILKNLSEHLRMEVLLYSCQNLVEHVQIFKGLSRPAVGCILALLKQEIFLPKDLVMFTERDKGKLFFMLYGTCQVNIAGGAEIAHVEDGNQFGELKIFEDENQIRLVYKVVAAEISEVYSMNEDDLYYCCSHYPEIVPKLKTMINHNRNRYFQQMTSIGHEIDTTDILSELRRGKILMHGRLRDDF